MKVLYKKRGCRVIYYHVTQGRAKRILRNMAKRLRKRGIECTFTTNKFDMCSHRTDCTYFRISKRLTVYHW